jgi:selenide, water dikinase
MTRTADASAPNVVRGAHGGACRFVDRVGSLLRRVQTNADKATIVVVGGGAGGVEIAFAIHHRLSTAFGGQQAASPSSSSHADGYSSPDMSQSPFSVTLVTSGKVLSAYPARARRLVLEAAAERDLMVREETRVTRVEEGALHTQAHEVLPFTECLWCIGAAPAEWLKDAPLPKGVLGLHAYCCAADCRPAVSSQEAAVAMQHLCTSS